jgi:hypothetical protein
MNIEKGVPVPKQKIHLRWRSIVDQWDVTDSILCDTESDAVNLRSAARRVGQRTCQRKGAGGWRVWRTA